jgi:glucosamine 6-phosphate synthetase-like amidotransferase/phosphosugar isomerase protein
VNAHPHVAGPVAVVHNGIIENHLALRAELRAAGCEILSDTDTELVAHLVRARGGRRALLETAVRRSLARLHGAYAIAVLSSLEPGRIVVAKHSSPLVLGLGEGATYCASDVPAMLALHAQHAVHGGRRDGRARGQRRDGHHGGRCPGARAPCSASTGRPPWPRRPATSTSC